MPENDPQTIDRAGTATTYAVTVQGSASGVAVPVSVSSIALPTGASTSALQTTGNASLASIDGKIPASPAAEHTTAASPNAARLSDGAAFYDATKTGQLPAALVTGRLDVNIGASSATVPVSGTVTTTPPSNASTNLAQVAGATTATGHGSAAGALRVELPTDGTGTVGLIAGAALIGKVGIDQTTPGTTNAVAQSGTWNVTNVSGTVSLPTGAATSALQTQISAQLPTALDSSGYLKVHEQGSPALPTGALSEATFQRFWFEQLVRQRDLIQLQSQMSGQAVFLPEMPGFLAG